ncbi:MAG: hypothetical protein ACP5M9_02375 [Candidatus Micrarchaeia archaeon]
MSNFFKNLTLSGEENAFIQSKTLTDFALKANKEFKEMINNNSKRSTISKIRNLSAKEYFSLSHMITSGSIAPNILDDMLLLINKEESILDYLFALMRQYQRYGSNDKKINEYLDTSLFSFTKNADESITLLSKMHKAKKLSMVKSYRSRIKEIENEVDMFRDSLLDFAYTVKTDFKLFYHITELAYLCDSVIDSCEDSSDLFLSIMLSILS